MFRSEYFWKLFASHAALVVSMALAAAAWVRLDGSALGALFAATVAGLALTVPLAWRRTRSVRRVQAAVEAIGHGAYAQRVPVPSRDELGSIARSVNAMSDELRRSMAMTSADRNKLNAILASMVEGVVAVDRDERIVHMNQVAGRLLGAVPDEVAARPIWEVTRNREIMEMLSETLHTEAVGHRTVSLPGQTDRFLDLHSSPLRAEGGVVAGAVLVLHDITQLRRLETVRRDFVGNVSHELKTPVTAIRALVETLIDDPEIEPGLRRRFLGKISRQAERMSNLVTDLLSLSRLEASAEPLHLSALDVREVCEETIRQLQPASDERRVAVARDWPDEALLVDGEEEALRQALGNLLSNAIKYSPEGSRVTMRASGGSGSVLIEVEDEGPGIEPRHHERLFERFYRVDAARSRELGGTGLGLAIVKHTVRALGGEVSVDSVPGRGSIFRMRLPASKEADCMIRASE